MGRLTLNILLSFAQFEREVIGERIRDKFAASRKKGMWMGGFVPLGYDVKDRKLVVNEAEAATVRMIFERFTKVGSATALMRALRAEGVTGKRGKLIDKGYLYKLLNNRVYVGEAVHKGTAYPGEHQAIIDRALWDRVHAILRESPRKRAANTRAQTPALLKGLIFGPTGRAMTPAHTRKGGKLYRYYVSTDVLKRDAEACTGAARPGGRDRERGRRPAARLAARAGDHRRHWRAARQSMDDITEAEVREALQRLDPLWDELFPAEQARIVQLLVERVDVSPDGADIRLRTEGLTNLVATCAPSNRNPGGRRNDRAQSHRRWPNRHRARADFDPQARRPEACPRARRHERDDGARRRHIDNAMVKAIARAFRWREMLENGEHATIRGDRRGREDQRDLRRSRAAADAAGAGHR